MSKIHNIKVHPSVVPALAQGLKTFEFRFNDRDYQVGDTLVMTPFDPQHPDITARGFLTFSVSYIIEGPAFGIPTGYCIMSITKP